MTWTVTSDDEGNIFIPGYMVPESWRGKLCSVEVDEHGVIRLTLVEEEPSREMVAESRDPQ